MKLNIKDWFIRTPREEMLYNAFKFVDSSKVHGDYYEFGVYKGKNFISAYKMAKKLKIPYMKFYAFDSFKGLPRIDKEDVPDCYFQSGMYNCSYKVFVDKLVKKNVNLRLVEIVEGYFEDVLNDDLNIRINDIAIVWIDCDLYTSTVPVLNFLTDKIQNGTVIIFDDYYCFKADKNKGERRAFEEWLKKNPQISATQYHRFGWHGNSFIIHKNDKPKKRI